MYLFLYNFEIYEGVLINELIGLFLSYLSAN